MSQPTNGPASPEAARITVLISGSGTNLQALIDASNTPSLPSVQFVRVISDRKDVRGIQRASVAGIPTAYHGILPYKKKHPDPSPEPTFPEARCAYDADLAALVLADNPHLVVCAGFMRILSPTFLDLLNNAGVPILNLHPSLHGDLVGAHCIEDAWEEYQAGRRTKTGVMIHRVIAEVDMGEPIVQREVSIEGCASLQELQQRLQSTEHPLIVEGVKMAIEMSRKKGQIGTFGT